MSTTATSASAGYERDAIAFGGLVPCAAVARGGETLVAVLGLEHHRDGAVLHMMVLTESPGLIDWAADTGLVVHDDAGTTYTATAIAQSQGLGQVATTVWISPAIPAEAQRLDLVTDDLLRVIPPRGGEPPVTRPLSGGPWGVAVDLSPERTVVDPPPQPERRQRIPDPGSVPARAIGAFVDVIPVGQARMAEGVAVCAVSAERYWDRWILTLAALGPPEQPGTAPAIGRAAIAVWDDLGNRYGATPLHGNARESWSEVTVELVPALVADARAIGVRIADIPRGNDVGPLPIPGPVMFGFRVCE